ncbi:MAG: hypothetical protein QXG03_00870 [Halalkalicoccus sp.]
MTIRSTTRAIEADEFDGRAAISVPSQGRDGAIDRIQVVATYADDEFVLVVYDATMGVVGTGDPVPAGETFEGSIRLDRPLTETQTVTVVLHGVEDGEPGERVRVNDVVVLDNATVGKQRFLAGGGRR